MRKLLDLELLVEKVLIGGDMNRTFKVKNPATLIQMANENVTPIPASSLKGLLRYLACIAARRMNMKKEYFELFGQDVGVRDSRESGLRDRCFGDKASRYFNMHGKIVFVNKGVSKNSIVPIVNPGISIDPVTRRVKEGSLWFYQYYTSKVSEAIPVRFEIWVNNDLSVNERKLLCYALKLLKHREIGGRVTVGLGRIVDVKITPENFCSEG